MRKSIALVAHDNKKVDLMEWVGHNRSLLKLHSLYATGTTGRLLQEYLGVEIAIFIIYALGFNLLLGYTGLPSFGHGAFLGVGAYSYGLFQGVFPNLFAGLVVASLCAGVAAGIVALFLPVVVGGLLLFTAGFFAAHAVASGWVPVRSRTGKAQASSLYTLFYYGGWSVLGWASAALGRAAAARAMVKVAAPERKLRVKLFMTHPRDRRRSGAASPRRSFTPPPANKRAVFTCADPAPPSINACTPAYYAGAGRKCATGPSTGASFA